tara:strand:+ start:380 stop:571 length:192 start_codon:yes stop_codon:yes gene_type:complete
MVIEVVRKPKKKPLKSVDPVLRRAVEVTISNEKAAEEAKKEEDAKRALTLQRRKGTSAPYGSI